MESPNATNPIHRELSAAEQSLFTFFRLSYLHAQGDEPTQIRLFLWANKKGLLDQLDVPASLPDQVRDRLEIPNRHLKSWRQPYEIILPFRALIGAAHGDLPPHHSGYNDRGGIQEARFLSENRASAETLLYRVMIYIIRRDTTYQKRPRDGRTNPTADNSMNDPHSSFFRRYVIQGKNPGHEIYQVVYREGMQLIQRYRTETNFLKHPVIGIRRRKVTKALRELSQKWERNHPGQHFLL